MKNALILHGIGGHAGIHWQQWLHDELVKREYRVCMPDLPNTDRPDREKWMQFVRRKVKDFNFRELIVVGHSLGVTTALDLIETEGRVVKGLVSVSGFHLDYGAELNSYFLKKKKIDLSIVKTLVEHSVVIYGEDDPYVPQGVLNNLARGLGVQPIVIENGGHLNTNSGYTEFPLLLELIEEDL